MGARSDMMRVTKPSDVPDGSHVAVLVYKTVSVDTGWGQSEQAPALEYWVSPSGDGAAIAAFVRDLEIPAAYAAKVPYSVVNVASKCAVAVDVVVRVP